MPLSPEQVLNKSFNTTQFRKGYEERDVDDFLDEVVAAMRSLIEQRDNYLKQLNDCRASKNQPAVRPSDSTGDAEDGVEQEQLQAISAKIEDAERAFKAHSDRAARAEAEADAAEREAQERIERARAEAEAAESGQAVAGEASAAVTEGRPDSSAPAAAMASAGAGLGANQLIELATRVHDEHVAAGQARHDELVSTGQAKHDELVSTGQAKHDESVRAAEELTVKSTSERDEMLSSAATQRDHMLAEATSKRDEMLTEARERSTGMVAEAQQKKAGVLEELDRAKDLIDLKIDELRGFERNYRTNLKSYIEGQLHDLEGSAQEPEKASVGEPAETAQG